MAAGKKQLRENNEFYGEAVPKIIDKTFKYVSTSVRCFSADDDTYRFDEDGNMRYATRAFVFREVTDNYVDPATNEKRDVLNQIC